MLRRPTVCRCILHTLSMYLYLAERRWSFRCRTSAPQCAKIALFLAKTGSETFISKWSKNGGAHVEIALFREYYPRDVGVFILSINLC